MRILTLIVALTISTTCFAATTGAVTHRRQHGLALVAPHCVKGVPCGKTCIAKGKVCHEPAATSAGTPVAHPGY